MKITDVRIRKMDNGGKRRAIASITFDSEFVVHDISVIETENGTFISMPSKRLPNGEYRDIAHPITSETRNKIQDAVLDAYTNEIGQY